MATRSTESEVNCSKAKRSRVVATPVLGCAALTIALCIAVARPVTAAPYTASRTGDVIRLEDAASQTVVSIAASVGNIAFEFSVKGHNVLHWPFASVDDFKARPAMSGIPFVGP